MNRDSFMKPKPGYEQEIFNTFKQQNVLNVLENANYP